MEAIKEFFTNSEWDLIYDLVSNNAEFTESDEEREDYDFIVNKIYNLFKTDEVTL
jgi:hypothetical protein